MGNKKLLLIALVLIGLSLGLSHAAVPQLIQSATGVDTGFASSVTATFGTTTYSGGNIIVVAWEGDAIGKNGAHTPTDSAGDTFVRIYSNSISTTFDNEMWVANNIVGHASDAVTVTDTGGGTDGTLIIEEWSGLSNTVDVVGTNSYDGAGINLVVSNSIINTNANDVLFISAASNRAGYPTSVGAGFGNFITANTIYSSVSIESNTIATTGTWNGLIHLGGNGVWVSGIVALEVIPSTCGFTVSNTLLNFGTIYPGNSINTQNAILITNTGSTASNILFSASTWAYNANTFASTNTGWDWKSGTSYASSNDLQSSATDSLVSLTGGGTKNAYFSLNIPSGKAGGNYAQGITIGSSC